MGQDWFGGAGSDMLIGRKGTEGEEGRGKKIRKEKRKEERESGDASPHSKEIP